jgi:hypothetical protein
MNAGKLTLLIAVSLIAVNCSNEKKKKTSGGNSQNLPYCQNQYGASPSPSPLTTGTTAGSTNTWSLHDDAEGDESSYGYGLVQTTTVVWEPTVRTLFAQNCATAGCHDASTRAGSFDYTNETSARQGLASAITSVQMARMPQNNTTFNQTNPQFLSTLQQWQLSSNTTGTTTNTYGNGSYTNNSQNCQPTTTTGNTTYN